jgi:hypothetical protein
VSPPIAADTHRSGSISPTQNENVDEVVCSIVFAPDAEDGLDAEALEGARARGFRLATRCLDCGHWLVAERSVSQHRGPRCAARVVV